jgi:phospholipid/cholesterol/gamma-HCH transport system substrate-binding protein
MRTMTPLARTTAGLLVVVFLTAVGYAGTRIAMGALDEQVTFTVALGETGQGLVSGGDVKVRGVIVGEVGEITLTDNLQAVAEVKLDPRYSIPKRSVFVITNKTLLGEKQIEVRFDGPIDQGPFIAQGEQIDDPDQVVEFENVLGTLSDLAEAIDEDDLVTVVDDFIGAFDGQGPAIARSIDEGARAAHVFERSLDDQVANNRDLSLVAQELSDKGGTFNRLGRASVQGLPTLSDNQAEIRRLVEDLTEFSKTLDATLTVNRDDLDRMIISGDNVIRLLGRYDVEVGQVMSGLVSYTEKFGTGFQHPDFKGQAARFTAILKEDIFAELCLLPEPLRSEIPQCAGKGGGGGGGGGGDDPPIDIPDLPDLPDLPDPPIANAQTTPRDLIAPQVETRYGLEALLERSLSDGGSGG